MFVCVDTTHWQMCSTPPHPVKIKTTSPGVLYFSPRPHGANKAVKTYILCVRAQVCVCVWDQDNWTSPSFLSLSLCCPVRGSIKYPLFLWPGPGPWKWKCVCECDRECMTQRERNREATGWTNWESGWGKYICLLLLCMCVYVCVWER